MILFFILFVIVKPFLLIIVLMWFGGDVTFAFDVYYHLKLYITYVCTYSVLLYQLYALSPFSSSFN